MPRRGREKINMVKGSEKAMEAFTYEIAKELGLEEKVKKGYKHLTTFEAGTLGGTITRTIQAMGEQLIMHNFDQGKPLIPDDLKPDKGLMRNMTNNGNLVVDGKITDTKDEIDEIIESKLQEPGAR